MENQIEEKIIDTPMGVSTRSKPRMALMVILGVVSLVVAAGVVIYSLTTQAQPVKSRVLTPVTSAEIEQRWGIRVTRIGVTADGGLVDFRYIVLDPDKALAMIQEEKNLPVLVPEGQPGLVNSAAMMPAKHNLNPGQTYFLLYRNTRGVIKPDSKISVVFGDVRLEHFSVL